VRGLVLFLVLWAGPVLAVQPDERLADPAMEARARTLSRDLRCVVCQNESIDASAAPLARDIRVLLRERLVAGDDDRAAVAFLVARYGDFVLLRPPVRPDTWVLWFGPFAVLLAGGVVTVLALRRRAVGVGPKPLSVEEEVRLAALLRDEEGRR